MKVVETAAELRALRAGLLGPVGFVPTMGALHDGHATLVKRARAQTRSVVTSLFVNPTQFGPGEDYDGYPRNRERDLEIFASSGADVVFVPAVDEIYPSDALTTVDPGPIGQVLEGERRPGHFKGVATVVTKLFAIVRPDQAFFGEKDAQQLRIIRRLASDLRFGVEIVGVATVRAADGLALSSRNIYLSKDERNQAPVLFGALRHAQDLFQAGERNGDVLRSAITATVGKSRLVSLEYVSVADSSTLAELSTIDREALVSLAARLGRTRLIDNMTLPQGLSPAGTGRD